MPIFNLEKFREALIDYEMSRVERNIDSSILAVETFYNRSLKRCADYCKAYHFEQNEIECSGFYKITRLTGEKDNQPNEIYQYIITFTTPQEEPWILLNSVTYDTYSTCSIIYDIFGLIPQTWDEWLLLYINDFIFEKRDVNKLIKLMNDKRFTMRSVPYKAMLAKAVEEQWVEATAIMLRFVKDNGIYKEQLELRL